MVLYLLEITRYIVVTFSGLFLLDNIVSLIRRGEEERIGSYFRQQICLFIIQFFAFATLWLESDNIQYLQVYIISQIFYVVVLNVTPFIYAKVNLFLLNNMCFMIGTGLILVSRLSISKAIRQLCIGCLAYVIALFIPYIFSKIKVLRTCWWFYALIGFVPILAVLLIGTITKGANLTFSILDITFQPSEFVKIAFVMFLATYLRKYKDFKHIAISAVIAGSYIIVLALSTDLGAALIFFVIYIVMVFLSTGNYWYLGAGITGGVAASIVAYHLFSHVQIRVLAWMNPLEYIENEGYQVSQSLFAISSGGLFGVGLLDGNPTAIPYVEEDFIFSALCEEMGAVFAVIFMLICLTMFLMMMKVGYKSRSKWATLVCTGLATSYIFQVFLTIGGGIKFIPLTGVTLPLVSYGGSSIMATIFSIFVIQSMVCGYNRKSKYSDGITKGEFYNSVALQILVIGLFIAMSSYLVNFVIQNEKEMMNNSFNSREELLSEQNYRGSIYAATGELLAQTIVENDGTETRYYPYGELFAHTVGYSTYGKSGVEELANYYLMHSNISISNKIENELNGVKNLGDNVYTTLHLDIQEVAQNALGVYSGAIIVTNVKTGEIIAMVSNPGFDPNEIESVWDELTEDTSSSVLLNRATQGLYPPGSIFKVITTLEYLRENDYDYESYSYNCTSTFIQNSLKVQCYNGSVHGYVDLEDSLVESCNCSFANIGYGLNFDAFANTLNELLFNETLPTELTTKSSTFDFSGEDEYSELEAVIHSAFGQGKTLVTPLHMHMITSAIANGGILMEPYILSSVVSATGIEVETFSSESYGRLMTGEESEILTYLMTQVVEDGTASNLNDLSYTVAGKTGSAEYNSNEYDSHSWFTGFAPADDPEIAISIIMEEAGSGSSYAVPMAKRILNEYFGKDES
ncbi:MAG: FtsW/RodA/SpoVE family cell cycle protein [Lachnospiraceae bacterium]